MCDGRIDAWLYVYGNSKRKDQTIDLCDNSINMYGKFKPVLDFMGSFLALASKTNCTFLIPTIPISETVSGSFKLNSVLSSGTHLLQHGGVRMRPSHPDPNGIRFNKFNASTCLLISVKEERRSWSETPLA